MMRLPLVRSAPSPASPAMRSARAAASRASSISASREDGRRGRGASRPRPAPARRSRRRPRRPRLCARRRDLAPRAPASACPAASALLGGPRRCGSRARRDSPLARPRRRAAGLELRLPHATERCRRWLAAASASSRASISAARRISVRCVADRAGDRRRARRSRPPRRRRAPTGIARRPSQTPAATTATATSQPRDGGQRSPDVSPDR